MLKSNKASSIAMMNGRSNHRSSSKEAKKNKTPPAQMRNAASRSLRFEVEADGNRQQRKKRTGRKERQQAAKRKKFAQTAMVAGCDQDAEVAGVEMVGVAELDVFSFGHSVRYKDTMGRPKKKEAKRTSPRGLGLGTESS